MRRILLAAAVAFAAGTAPASADWTVAGAPIGKGTGKAAGQFGTGRSTVAEGGDRQFDSPGGLAVDAAGVVYAADPSNHRIQRFGPDGSPRGSFGRHGFDPGAKRRVAGIGRINLPIGVALDGRGSVYVADNRNDRISRWSTAGRWRARVSRRGSGAGTMTSPWGIAIRGTAIYVVDGANQRISRYATSGRYLGSFGRPGAARGQLLNPYGIAVSPAGIVYVTDASKDEILRYSLGGRYLGSFGSSGRGPGQFERVTGVAVHPLSGQVFVADYCGQRIERFDASGVFLGAFGSSVLATPTFLAFSAQGRLYVADYGTIIQFADVPGAAAARASAFNPGTANCFED